MASKKRLAVIPESFAAKRHSASFHHFSGRLAEYVKGVLCFDFDFHYPKKL
jgi:hypothetical protein